jgi:hypothetical protein
MTIKILSLKEPVQVTVGSLSYGSAFRRDGVVYVKTDEGEDAPLCMRVTGSEPGYLHEFDGGELVEPATLEISVTVGGGQ